MAAIVSDARAISQSLVTNRQSLLMERTFILLKPDCVQRRLMGRIITRFEEKGLNVIAAKMLVITPELAKQHYAEHVQKGWYPTLEGFITGGPVLAAVLEGLLEDRLHAAEQHELPARLRPCPLLAQAPADMATAVIHAPTAEPLPGRLAAAGLALAGLPLGAGVATRPLVP